jgi:uncharacterized membrane protein YedE/YeeE
MLMLAVACLLFAPILANQLSFKDVPVTGSVSPIGWGLFVGALIFGVGMQLGGSCASGTLFAIGSGQSAILLTLTGFIGGATLGALHLPWWNRLPTHDPVSLTQWGGYPGALAISLTAMALIVALTYVVGRRRTPPPPLEEAPVARGAARAIRGSWPLWVGALLLAGLNAVTLFVSGGAWGVTFAFALWGSKILDAVGVDVQSWGFWQDPANLAKYDAGIFVEKTSVMDFGIIIGALIASALAGQWVLHRKVPPKLAIGAVIGGLLMGYGARLAFGCNIGAYFGGIASFSLHGWIWGVMAIVGTVGGLALRPLFGLTNPKPTDSVC